MNVNRLIEVLSELPADIREQDIVTWCPDMDGWMPVTVVTSGVPEGVRLYTDVDDVGEDQEMLDNNDREGES